MRHRLLHAECLVAVRAGETPLVPVDLAITREMEGPFTGLVRASSDEGRRLFEGEYRFVCPAFSLEEAPRETCPDDVWLLTLE